MDRPEVDPLTVINTGDYVKIDGDPRTIEIIPKNTD